MRASASRRWRLLPTILGVTSTLSGQEIKSPPTTDNASTALLQGWDQKENEVRQTIWTLYAATAALGKDSRGKTVSDDMAAWVMTPGVREQLRTVRYQAQHLLQAGDEQGARAALRAGEATLAEQSRRLELLNLYWWEQPQLARQRQLWQRWLKEAPADVAGAGKTQISGLETALSNKFSAELTLTGLQADINRLLLAYNDDRLRLAELVSKQQVAAGHVLASRDRSVPCPDPAQSPPGQQPKEHSPPGPATPPPLEQFYPSEAQKARISGKVILKLTIARDGCMQHAEVTGSSGAPEIDDAALDTAEHMRFLPARQDGKPVQDSFLMAFNFVLDNVSFAAKTPAQTDRSAVHRANELLDRGDYDGAIALLNTLLQQDPTDATALADRGLAHMWKYETPLARADLDRAGELEPRNAVVFRGRGMLALRAREFGRSIAFFTTSLEFDPKNLFAMSWRTAAALRSGDTDQALTYNAQMIQAWPADTGLYVTRAFILRARHQPEEAVGQADAVIKANPTSAAAYTAAGVIYAAGGKDAQAMHAFDQAVTLSPSEATYLERAAYRSRGDVAGRQADIDAALKLHPNSAPAALSRIQMLMETGAHADALDLALRESIIYPDNDYFLIRRGIGSLKIQLGAQGDKDLEQARARATTPQALNRLCWELATAGVALERALSACDAALARAPLEAAFLDSRGFVLLRLGRNAESIKAYDEALKSMPFEPNSLYGRALAHRRLGNQAAAEKDFQAAIALNARVAEQFASFGLKP